MMLKRFPMRTLTLRHYFDCQLCFVFVVRTMVLQTLDDDKSDIILTSPPKSTKADPVIRLTNGLPSLPGKKGQYPAMTVGMLTRRREPKRKANLRDVRPLVEDDAKWRSSELASPDAPPACLPSFPYSNNTFWL
jgi:hypothetical protein